MEKSREEKVSHTDSSGFPCICFIYLGFGKFVAFFSLLVEEWLFVIQKCVVEGKFEINSIVTRIESEIIYTRSYILSGIRVKRREK